MSSSSSTRRGALFLATGASRDGPVAGRIAHRSNSILDGASSSAAMPRGDSLIRVPSHSRGGGIDSFAPQSASCRVLASERMAPESFDAARGAVGTARNAAPATPAARSSGYSVRRNVRARRRRRDSLRCSCCGGRQHNAGSAICSSATGTHHHHFAECLSWRYPGGRRIYHSGGLVPRVFRIRAALRDRDSVCIAL